MKSYAPGQVKELTGRVALVTGGAQRVGLEIARALADAGTDMAIGYRRSAAAARAAARELRARGVRCIALRADVARPAGARARHDGGAAPGSARHPGQQRGALLPHPGREHDARAVR